MSLAQDGGAWSSMVFTPDTWQERWKVKRTGFQDDSGYPTGAGTKSAEDKYLSATDAAKKRAGSCCLSWDYRDPKTVYPVWIGEHDLGAAIVVTEHPKWRTLGE